MMRKPRLLLAGMLSGALSLAAAQETPHKSGSLGASNRPEMKATRKKEYVLKKDGQIKLIRLGQEMLLKWDIPMPDGSIIKKDGFIVRKDGSKVGIKEGEMLATDGHPMNFLEATKAGYDVGDRSKRPSASELGVIAIVGETPIPYSHFRLLVGDYLAAVKNANPDAVKNLLLNRLVTNELLLLKASEYDIHVSPREVADSIRAHPEFQRDGKFDANLYSKFLTEKKIDRFEYEWLEQNTIEANKVTQRFVGDAKKSGDPATAPQRAIKAMNSYLEEKQAKIRIWTFPEDLGATR